MTKQHGLNMELELLYSNLIAHAKIRGLDKTKLDYYTETHHIVPLCMNGPDTSDNKVLLSGREHYQAHRILALLYPNHYGLQHAWWNMSTRNDTLGRDYIISDIEYEEARISFAKAHSLLWKNEVFRNKVITSQKERWKTNRESLIKTLKFNEPESINKRRLTLIETLSNPDIRKKYSEASKLNLSRPETKEKLSKISIDAWNKPGAKEKRLKQMRDIMSTPEVKEKHRIATSKAKRISPIWTSPIKEQLYSLWIEYDKIRSWKFKQVAIEHGFPDVSYEILIKNYFDKGIIP